MIRLAITLLVGLAIGDAISTALGVPVSLYALPVGAVLFAAHVALDRRRRGWPAATKGAIERQRKDFKLQLPGDRTWVPPARTSF